jgi:hypothetical protein
VTDGSNSTQSTKRNDDIILQLYHASLGRPTAAMRNNYRQEYENIVKVSNYRQFLDRLGYTFTPEQVTVLLRNAVRAACAKHYGGLKVSDIIGNSINEPLPTASTVSWEEVDRVATESYLIQTRAQGKSIWTQRKKELKLTKQSQSPQHLNQSALGNQTSHHENHVHTRHRSSKHGNDLGDRRNSNWKNTGRDTVPQSSNHFRPKEKRDLDSNWRK